MESREIDRRLAGALLGSGLLMAAYLLLRPYGDAEGLNADAADAFASSWWVVAHVCGAVALTLLVVTARRVSVLAAGRAGAVARLAGTWGLALVLPYCGAETFGLHAVGSAAQSDPVLIEIADDVRNQPVAITLFGVGLLLLASAAVALALAWRSTGARSRAAGLYGLLFALVLPQFFLPPAGRMAFGVACAVAASAWVVELLRGARVEPGVASRGSVSNH
ncbi:hypothetical protein [Nocardioides daejeonensis]|uniref:hypothetical protein n=1 Tax=Nocardioides daejeonensis TaxID=1046556 RepID=UPI000D750919|nr:hypothetical protein [Nocardioides daejeonensis]